MRKNSVFESIKSVDRSVTWFPHAINVQDLQDRAAEQGVNVIWANTLGNFIENYPDSRPIAIVFWHLDDSFWHYQPLLSSWADTKLIFYIYDSHVVVPYYYNKAKHHLFSRIYTWDDNLVDNRKYFKFWYSVMEPMDENLPSFDERKLATQISGDKSFSCRPYHELYSERKSVIRFFETHNSYNRFRTNQGTDLNLWPRLGAKSIQELSGHPRK